MASCGELDSALDVCSCDAEPAATDALAADVRLEPPGGLDCHGKAEQNGTSPVRPPDGEPPVENAGVIPVGLFWFTLQAAC